MAKLTKNNCLAIINPELCREWDYEKNYPLTPYDFSCNSTAVVWWKCKKCGKQWQAQIRHRNGGWYRCFYCRSLKNLCPELAKEWDYEKNYPLRPEDVTMSDRRVFYWECSKCGNKFKSRVVGRRGFDKKYFRCRKCHHSPKKNKSLAEINPELAKEWHPTKNGKLTPYDVAVSSIKEVWWECPKCGYVWKAKICHRNNKQSPCFKCKSLAYVNPLLASEWNYKKNGKLTPENVSFSSSKIIQWTCRRCHTDFAARISNRNAGNDCPKCCWDIKNVPGKKESLLFKYPEICKDWDYEKNGLLTPEAVRFDCYRYVYWKCHKCGYRWKASILSRAQGSNKCLYCNSLVALYPDIAKKWHPTKNGKLTPFDVTPHSQRKVYWQCPICGYVWYAVIGSQIYTLGCPSRSKIILKDGTACDSALDAYIYENCKESNVAFKYNRKYGGNMGNSRYDFYFEKERVFLELTGFNKDTNIINWPRYLRKIVRKKHFAENVLKAGFIFLQLNLRTAHIRYIKEYLREHLGKKCPKIN